MRFLFCIESDNFPYIWTGKKTLIPKRTRIPKENKKPPESNKPSDCGSRTSKKVLAKVEMNVKETNARNANGLAMYQDNGEDLDSSLIDRVSGFIFSSTVILLKTMAAKGW